LLNVLLFVFNFNAGAPRNQRRVRFVVRTGPVGPPVGHPVVGGENIRCGFVRERVFKELLNFGNIFIDEFYVLFIFSAKKFEVSILRARFTNNFAL
jgi:hypothetical protein